MYSSLKCFSMCTCREQFYKRFSQILQNCIISILIFCIKYTRPQEKDAHPFHLQYLICCAQWNHISFNIYKNLLKPYSSKGFEDILGSSYIVIILKGRQIQFSRKLLKFTICVWEGCFNFGLDFRKFKKENIKNQFIRGSIISILF